MRKLVTILLTLLITFSVSGSDVEKTLIEVLDFEKKANNVSVYFF